MYLKTQFICGLNKTSFFAALEQSSIKRKKRLGTAITRQRLRKIRSRNV